MNTKNDVEVIINGKQYTISGYESSDYLQRIATHINDKYAEFKQDEGYARLDVDMRNILLAINLSDDYYKAQQSMQELQRENEELEKEIFNMKHDMIAMKAQLEEQEKAMEDLQKDKTESEHEVIRLETELKNAKSANESGSCEAESASTAEEIVSDTAEKEEDSSVRKAAADEKQETEEEAVADANQTSDEKAATAGDTAVDEKTAADGNTVAEGKDVPGSYASYRNKKNHNSRQNGRRR